MAVRRIGDGPEVVWLHGLGEQSASFDAIARHPRLAGYTHVLPDLPGYGRSPWPDPDPTGRDSLARLASHLARWLADRESAEPPVLVGHSMGGVLALLVAERIPVAVVGCCTFT